MKTFEIEFNGVIPMSLTVLSNNESNAVEKACNSLNNLYTMENVASIKEVK